MMPPGSPIACLNDSTYDGVHERRRVERTRATAPLFPPAVSDSCVTQEAVWRDWAADGRRDRLGRLPHDSSVPRVAGLRLPGLEERLAGHSGIRGDGVCL